VEAEGLGGREVEDAAAEEVDMVRNSGRRQGSRVGGRRRRAVANER
jgi:hypothetical protein